MRNFLLIGTLFLLFYLPAKSQYVNIPDANFRSFLLNEFPSSFNASQMMDTTSPPIVNAGILNIAPLGTISNWDGFQYFKNLQVARFAGIITPYIPTLPNTLKTLDVGNVSSITDLPGLPAGLLYLDCHNSFGLTSLTLPPALQHLNCQGVHNLQPFTSLPASLQYLDITDDYLFTSLPTLPASLDTLGAEAASLTSLPALPSGLKVLTCRSNQLTSLPALPTELRYLDCTMNLITVLPALPAMLEHLEIRANQLMNMPTLPSTLTYLDFAQNQVPSLPALPASLVTLNCSNNLIATMPTLPVGLRSLDCWANQLSSLPTLPSTLTYLDCGSNQLTALPALPQSLNDLYVSSNQLTSIASLPGNISSFDCTNNQISFLPPLPAQLWFFGCGHNPLYYLPALPDSSMAVMTCNGCPNLTCLPVLPNALPATAPLIIYMDNTISCVANLPGSVEFAVTDTATGTQNSFASYPLCSAVNNINHCDAFPLMTGHVFNDNNGNSIHDANEPYRANVKVQLSNGAWTYSNSSGYYQLPADNTGNYTITVTPPNYFTSAPLQYNYNFTTFDTLVTNDFALQATAVVDSLNISITPVNWAARPGFSFPYLITYENGGTTTLNPNIVFNYDNTRLIYDSCSNTSVINGGSSLSLSETGFVAGQQKSFIGYFTVNPSVVIGDSLHAYAHITANAIAAHDTDVVVIRGAFDPNDKQATPTLSPAQVNSGDYIYYTIRFQNTGTDTAFSIVVTDTLSSRLQPTTLQMINTSHSCKTTVKGNAVSFEFINIQLPDSNVNQLKSHGYISFRIKPVNTLVENDIVPNKAAIYFDYNSPVITNIATTTVVDPVILPLKLLSFIASKGTGQGVNLYWQTSNEVSVQHYEIEMSTNGRTFNSIGSETAKGYQYNDYSRSVAIPLNPVLYFRLKMVDIDGRYTYSSIAIVRMDNANTSFNFLNNPVKNELNISVVDESLINTTATIFTAQGVKVKTILLQHDVEHVNIKSLPAGTYYLVTEKGSRQFVVVR